MHSKLKGNLGQFIISAKLAEYGFSVFSEEGDLSKIDLIAEKNGMLFRIQVKGITPVNNSIRLPLKKCGPNYNFKYDARNFDYFGVVDLQSKQAYLISSSILNEHQNLFTLRLKLSRNNQINKINNSKDYLFENVIHLLK